MDVPLDSEQCATYEITDSSFKPQKCRLKVYGDRLEIGKTDEPEIIIESAQRERIKFPMKGVVAFVNESRKDVWYRLPPEAIDAVKKWLGPPTIEDLKNALKEQLKWSLPIGMLYTLTSLPMSGNPASGIAPIPLDPLGLSLGVVLLATGGLSKLMPHRAYFIVDSIWVLALAGTNVKWVLAGSSKWWLLPVYFQLSMAVRSFREYRRFAPENIATDPGAAHQNNECKAQQL